MLKCSKVSVVDKSRSWKRASRWHRPNPVDASQHVWPNEARYFRPVECNFAVHLRVPTSVHNVTMHSCQTHCHVFENRSVLDGVVESGKASGSKNRVECWANVFRFKIKLDQRNMDKNWIFSSWTWPASLQWETFTVRPSVDVALIFRADA
jgi:hypothetical protein